MRSDENKNEQSGLVEMELLFPVLRKQLNSIADVKIVFDEVIPVARLSEEFELKDSKNKKPEVILAGDTAVELGHPDVLSKSIVMLTEKESLLTDGRISVYGKNIDKLQSKQKHPFVQIILLKVQNGQSPDPFKLETAQHLIHRLPGYMVRSIPGKLWVRISKTAVSKGLDFRVIGSALASVMKNEFESVEGVEVIFITSDTIDKKTISTFNDEVEVLAGRHKKLVLGIDGDLECDELNCDDCDEQEVCDNLREIIKAGKN